MVQGDGNVRCQRLHHDLGVDGRVGRGFDAGTQCKSIAAVGTVVAVGQEWREYWDIGHCQRRRRRGGGGVPAGRQGGACGGGGRR